MDTTPYELQLDPAADMPPGAAQELTDDLPPPCKYCGAFALYSLKTLGPAGQEVHTCLHDLMTAAQDFRSQFLQESPLDQS